VTYTRRVIGRLSAIVVVVVMAAAPVSAALCQITCEDAEMNGMSAMAGHAGHVHHARASVPVTAGVRTLHALPHVCADSSDAVVGVPQVPQSLDLPLAVTVHIESPSQTGLLVRAVRSRVEHSPPGDYRLTSQLRV
jgi:hypothetical protein